MWGVLIDVAVAVGLAAVVFGATLLGLLTGTTSSFDPRRNVRILVLSPRVRGLGILGVLGGVGAVGACVFYPPRDRNDLIALAVVGVLVAAFGAGVLLEGVRARIILSPEGIAERTSLGRVKFVPWGDIEKIEQRVSRDYRVWSRSGVKIVVPGPAYLDSFEWFVAACRANLAPAQCPESFGSQASG